MALGTILALAPRLPAPVAVRRPAADAASEPEPEPRDPEPREEVTRVKHPARIVALAVALVVVVLGVVLALNVGNDPQQDAKQSHLRRQGGTGVRPPERSTAGG